MNETGPVGYEKARAQNLRGKKKKKQYKNNESCLEKNPTLCTTFNFSQHNLKFS